MVAPLWNENRRNSNIRHAVGHRERHIGALSLDLRSCKWICNLVSAVACRLMSVSGPALVAALATMGARHHEREVIAL